MPHTSALEIAMPDARAKAAARPLAHQFSDAHRGATLTPSAIRDMVDLGDGVYVIQIDPNEAQSRADLGELHNDVKQRPAGASHGTSIHKKMAEFSVALQVQQHRARNTVAGGHARHPDQGHVLDALHAQSMDARSRHVDNGTLLGAAELWSRLGITRQAVSKQIKQSRMFSIDGPQGQKLYPAFFTDARFDQGALRRVCLTLGDLPGPGKWQFFTTGKASLGGRTPLDAVADGDLDATLAAATAFRGR